MEGECVPETDLTGERMVRGYRICIAGDPYVGPWDFIGLIHNGSELPRKTAGCHQSGLPCRRRM